MSLRNSAYLGQMRPVLLDFRGEVEDGEHVHGFADIIFIPASPAGATTMSSSEGEGQTTCVYALSSDWPGFIHGAWRVGYLGGGGMEVGLWRTEGIASRSTDGGRGRILDAVRKIPIWAQRTTRPRPAFACIRLCFAGEGENIRERALFPLGEAKRNGKEMGDLSSN